MEYLLAIRFCVSALYLTAAIAYVRLLLSGKKQAKFPIRLLGTGLVVHFGEVIARGAESGAAGGAPFAGLSGFASVFSLLLGFIYFLLEKRYSKRYRIASLGAFHVPVLFIMHFWSVLLKQPISEIPPLNTGILFVFHVVPAICAYAALTVSFVTGIAYLLLERQLRQKHFGILLQGLPNLDLVERVSAAAVKIGVFLLSFGVLVGLTMGYLEWGPKFEWDFKVWVSLVVVLVFGLSLALRRFAGWTGRRSVVITVTGFAMILINVTVINYFFSKLHGFI